MATEVRSELWPLRDKSLGSRAIFLYCSAVVFPAASVKFPFFISGLLGLAEPVTTSHHL